MTRLEHYLLAEKFLSMARVDSQGGIYYSDRYLAAAQVHALLAQVDKTGIYDDEAV